MQPMVVRDRNPAGRRAWPVRFLFTTAVTAGVLGACGHAHGATSSGEMKGHAYINPNSPRCTATTHEMAWIADLRAGEGASQAAAQGFQVFGRVTAPSEDLLFVNGPNPKQLVTAGVASAVGPLNPQSGNPAYLSCDLTLADNTQDQAFAASARSAALVQGLATPAEISSPGLIETVGDDPFVSGQVIVNLSIASQSQAGGHFDSRHCVIAIESAAGQVLAIGTVQLP